MRFMIAVGVLLLMWRGSTAEDSLIDIVVGARFAAVDSLQPTPDKSVDAQACLASLTWPPDQFNVELQATEPERGMFLVRFPSPVVTGDVVNDSVSMEWYALQDEEGKVATAPAVVVVHESGRGMNAGRIFARSLHAKGLHTFLIHLPYYGKRTDGPRRIDASTLFVRIRQGVADVRRARDAVCALPCVNREHIALQGTSLGGFVASTAASIDFAYESVHLMLSGGDLYSIVMNGQRDAAKVREQLEAAGITGDALKELAYSIEPNRVAHRLDPQRTWLYSGNFDTVVPPENALSLARTAHLDAEHHVRLPCDHYSGVVFLPMVVQHIANKVSSPRLSVD